MSALQAARQLLLRAYIDAVSALLVKLPIFFRMKPFIIGGCAFVQTAEQVVRLTVQNLKQLIQNILARMTNVPLIVSYGGRRYSDFLRESFLGVSQPFPKRSQILLADIFLPT